MAMERKLLGAAPLMFLVSACFAGPCTDEIDRVQVKVDARIGAIAKGGRLGKESVAAQLNRQPTPESIAAAEAKLGEGRRAEEAVAALARARRRIAPATRALASKRWRTPNARSVNRRCQD
jgi:hypothetical protein